MPQELQPDRLAADGQPQAPDPSEIVDLSDPEPPPDRERRSPAYRWLMHLGLPAGVSLGVHVLLIGFLSLKTWEALVRPAPPPADLAATLAAPPRGPALDWNMQAGAAPAAADAPDVATTIAPTDFGPLMAIDPGAFAAPTGAPADRHDGPALSSGRLALLGTGGGSGPAGTGGLGRGDGARGGRFGQAAAWNVAVPAQRIVYVVDFSGSILVAVDDLKRELKRSISRLSADQVFNVIVFYGESGGGREQYHTESFAAQLQPATADVRREFFAWLERQVPRGATEPVAALRRALASAPHAVFLFTDGYFEDAAVDEITQANRGVKAQIVCFVFDELLLQDESGLPRETDGTRRLRRVAEQNHGQVKIVTGADLKP